MKKIVPYFTIKGNAEKALDLYKKCFGGEVIFEQRFSETPYDVSASYKQKIAHAEFKSEGVHFYVSDGFENEDATFGNGIGMSVDFDSAEEQHHVFKILKEEGEVTFDFFETTIGTSLVCVIDKFGVHWYLNYIPQENAER